MWKAFVHLMTTSLANPFGRDWADIKSEASESENSTFYFCIEAFFQTIDVNGA